MTHILAHNSSSNKNYAGIIGSAYKHIPNMGTGDLHNTMFDTISVSNPDIVLLPAHEYTIEFHEAIKNHPNIIFILIIDKNVSALMQRKENLFNFWNNQKNVKVIHQNIPDLNTNNKNITFDHLYSNDIFYNRHLVRNNKVCVLLSSDEEKNQIIKPFLYPNSDNIVCFNNPNFDHPTNLGVLTYIDLAQILNTYTYAVDLSNQFMVEIHECGCQILNPSTMLAFESPFDLNYQTYDSFVNSNLFQAILER